METSVGYCTAGWCAKKTHHSENTILGEEEGKTANTLITKSTQIKNTSVRICKTKHRKF